MNANVVSRSVGILMLSIFMVVLFSGSGHALTYSLPNENAIEVWGDAVDVNCGIAVAEGDVNGDGYGDMIIGAPYASPAGREKAGTVYIILGGAGFPSANPIDLGAGGANMVIHGANTFDLLGTALAAADVNNDGIDDIILGAQGADYPGTMSPGIVYVIFGKPSLPSLFDLNGSSADVTIASDESESRPFHYYYPGMAVASGDINGDDIQDIIIGLHGAHNSAGKVYVVFGKSSLPGTILLSDSADVSIWGAEPDGYLGNRVVAGDINGDTFDDLIMGAWGANLLAGKVYVVFGSNGLISPIDLALIPADITIVGDNRRDYLGSSLACSDLTGDGIDDLAVGAWAADPSGKTGSGKVYLFYGSRSFVTPLVIDLNTTSADATLDGPQISGRFGYTIASGDVNGNGINDLLVGAYGTDSMAGRVYVIYGNTTIASTFDMEISGEQAYDQLGVALACGDLNGDKAGDIICSAFKAGPAARNGAGKTYIIRGTLQADTPQESPEDEDTDTEDEEEDTDTDVIDEDTDTDSSARLTCFIATAAFASTARPHGQEPVVFTGVNWLSLTGSLIMGLILGALLRIHGGPLKRGRHWRSKKKVMAEKITKFSTLILLLAGAALALSFSIAEAVPLEHHGTTEGCRRCHLIHGRQDGANLASIKGTITPPTLGLPDKSVLFTARTGVNSYADGDATYDGICEICHTQTKYFKNDTWNDPLPPDSCVPHKSKYAGEDCRPCHSHEDGFAHGGGASCDGCHGHDDGYGAGTYFGTTVSHSTHTETDADDQRGLGMNLECSGCHNTSSFPCFSDDKDLTNTNACDTCHSPGGGFNGVVSAGGSVGAKTNWESAIYQVDETLSPGKQKWCVGCHDSAPSVVNSQTAPDIGGDNSTYGYYFSAHANGTYGVLRSGVGFPRGECFHCHEIAGPGASHGGQLFYGLYTACNHTCYKCHNLIALGETMEVLNYIYAYNFGGGPAEYSTGRPVPDDTIIYDTIMKQFCNDNSLVDYCGSSHNLDKVYNAIRNDKYGWGFPVSPNPCSGCHNVHLAERIGSTQDPPSYPYDPSKAPISRPSDHNNLWGDDAAERMDVYAASVGGVYLAPYYADTVSGTYEPAGDGISDGSNMPDYVSLCLDCHQYTQTGDDGRLVGPINWGDPNFVGTTLDPLKGDRHGGIPSGQNDCYPNPWEEGSLRAPYSDALKEDGYNYVLSCTDCHEPHGTPNRIQLIRRFVNGEAVAIETAGCDVAVGWHGTEEGWIALCDRCHTQTANHFDAGGCWQCHTHGVGWFSCGRGF